MQKTCRGYNFTTQWEAGLKEGVCVSDLKASVYTIFNLLPIDFTHVPRMELAAMNTISSLHRKTEKAVYNWTVYTIVLHVKHSLWEILFWIFSFSYYYYYFYCYYFASILSFHELNWIFFKLELVMTPCG